MGDTFYMTGIGATVRDARTDAVVKAQKLIGEHIYKEHDRWQDPVWRLTDCSARENSLPHTSDKRVIADCTFELTKGRA